MHNVLDTVPVHSSKRSSNVSFYDGGTPEPFAVTEVEKGFREKVALKLGLNT